MCVSYKFDWSEYNYMNMAKKIQKSFSLSFIAFAWKLEPNGNVSSDYLWTSLRLNVVVSLFLFSFLHINRSAYRDQENEQKYAL
jgi:hypothetical protein